MILCGVFDFPFELLRDTPPLILYFSFGGSLHLLLALENSPVITRRDANRDISSRLLINIGGP